MQIHWTIDARSDLSEISAYIARDNSSAAIKTIIRIVKVAEFLSSHPSLGRYGRVNETKEFIISGTPFILVYRINRTKIDILRVFHAARKWPEHF